MTDVFETILFFLFIWWVLQFLSRLVKPATATYKKNYTNFRPFQQAQQEYRKNEGETTIQFKNKQNIKQQPNDGGAEYVDYEEVK